MRRVELNESRRVETDDTVTACGAQYNGTRWLKALNNTNTTAYTLHRERDYLFNTKLIL